MPTSSAGERQRRSNGGSRANTQQNQPQPTVTRVFNGMNKAEATEAFLETHDPAEFIKTREHPNAPERITIAGETLERWGDTTSQGLNSEGRSQWATSYIMPNPNTGGTIVFEVIAREKKGSSYKKPKYEFYARKAEDGRYIETGTNFW